MLKFLLYVPFFILLVSSTPLSPLIPERHILAYVPVFFMSLKPWARQESGMGDFVEFLSCW